ncbi:MAG: PHP domain-containing protein [Clostridia bacterium]|nr:PHP domain-containing protein [Clostridia bacterium]
MRKYLLPEGGRFYKANLHMHTTVSDGKYTPEETKSVFMAQGYSIVAFSDHFRLVPHNELTDENFLAITAMEVGIDNGPWSRHMKTYHFGLISRKAEQSEYTWVDFPYSVEGANGLIEKFNREGFLVVYNHPVWSLQDYEDYSGLKGLWGVEVHNTLGELENLGENDRPLVDLLRRGQRVVPLATDDAHTPAQCFRGFTMVKAERLEYETVIAAYERGDFYSSEGPEIYELFVEGERVYVRCSPVKEISFATDRRHGEVLFAKDGELLTEASFSLREMMEDLALKDIPWEPHFRLVLTDQNGKRAWTRAYFKEDCGI